jgi:hypothetical protein
MCVYISSCCTLQQYCNEVVLPWGVYVDGVVVDAAVLPKLLHVKACIVLVGVAGTGGAGAHSHSVALCTTGAVAAADVHLLCVKEHYDVLYKSAMLQYARAYGEMEPFGKKCYSSSN